MALTGVLEEALLDDAETVHLAVAPLAAAGQPTWVAAIDKAWLQDELAALQKSGVFVDRVVPMAWPDDPPSGHFHAPPAAASAPSKTSSSPGPASTASPLCAWPAAWRAP